MTIQAINVLMDWCSQQSLETQKDFTSYFEKVTNGDLSNMQAREVEQIITEYVNESK